MALGLAAHQGIPQATLPPGISAYDIWRNVTTCAANRKQQPVSRANDGVIRYRSLRDENRSMSAMPPKRRLAVKASPVAMGDNWTRETGFSVSRKRFLIRP